ncbi:cytosine methyltransferase [Thalassospira lucentensis]|uniref:Cytosine-specific methyltransferase n=1 Tax=Thalassospira lucentensis TaxID=168935 RepID=A0A154L316_9PROT|nr:DNA (cytosine-5-)-methyltransferase [Thalassospira lucentensis]KZB62231.1 cytosine methyltransferase [Thalassospira lucentensis]
MSTFAEFFAGGGMARSGLGPDWACLFANDKDKKKVASYQLNWGNAEITDKDVKEVSSTDIIGEIDLVWASFPCQDLSLAGGGAGLKGEHSGTFYPFWKVIEQLILEERSPKIIVLENVLGTLSSHDGEDFRAICRSYKKSGYCFGAVVVDASLFVPQSRKRLFMIGVKNDIGLNEALVSPEPIEPFHTKRLRQAVNQLDPNCRDSFVWWNVPTPPHRNVTFADIIEDRPTGVVWHSEAETARLLELMTPVNLAKVTAAQRSERRMVGGVYRRMRKDADGNKVQRAEVQFSDVAGCLRTPRGGSSRQTLLIVDGQNIRSRLISTRETARLMGLDDTYKLPENYNEAYHLTGDGVVAPVVRHLAHHLFEPLLSY